MSPDVILTNVNGGFLLLICGFLSVIVPFSWGHQKNKSPDHFACPEEFGYHPHPTDCAQYYVCVFGEAVLESCTGGLMYSHDLQTCDWPRNVGCANLAGDSSSDVLITGNAALPPVVETGRSRQTTPTPSSPSSLWKQEVQPKQQQHSLPDKNLYEDDIGPAEEIETDRQQRVYRGQPPTIGQVARDRDGISRHTNALQTSVGSEKIKPVAVISFSSHHQNISKADHNLEEVVDNFLTPTQTQTEEPRRYKRSLDLRPPESVSTYIVEQPVSQNPTPNRVLYNASHYEPFYTAYDEDVELYKDIDYGQYQKSQSGKHQQNNGYQVIQQQPPTPQRPIQTQSSTQLYTRQPVFDTSDYNLQNDEDGQTQQSEKLSSVRWFPSSELEAAASLTDTENRGPSTFPPLYSSLSEYLSPPARPPQSSSLLSSFVSFPTGAVDSYANYNLSEHTDRTNKDKPASALNRLLEYETVRSEEVNFSLPKQQLPSSSTEDSFNEETINAQSKILLPPTTTTTTTTVRTTLRKSEVTGKQLPSSSSAEAASFRIVVPPINSKRKLVKSSGELSQLNIVPAFTFRSAQVPSFASTTSATTSSAATTTDAGTNDSAQFVTNINKPVTISNSRRFYVAEPNSLSSSPSNSTRSVSKTPPPPPLPKVNFTVRVPSPFTVSAEEQEEEEEKAAKEADREDEDDAYSREQENEIHNEDSYKDDDNRTNISNYLYDNFPSGFRESKRGPKDYSSDGKINSYANNVKSNNGGAMLNYTASSKLKTIIKSAMLFASNSGKLTTPLPAFSAAGPNANNPNVSLDTVTKQFQTTRAIVPAAIVGATAKYKPDKCPPPCNNDKQPYLRGRHRGSVTYTTAVNEFDHVTPSSGRNRPTLKPSNSIITKVVETDIYKFPPKRPDPIYPTPEVDKTAAKCRKDICLLPDCSCGGKDIPGDLPKDETPQIVLLTFDDSVNELNKGLYSDLFEKGRTNPNGCPISATFYVSHEWTDYSMVQNLYATGHEIASHSVSHSFGEQFSTRKWTKEIAGQREILSAYGGVRQEDIRGMRAPFLAIGGNKMFKMLHDANFTYDSSMPIYENKPPSWPYTLDYKIFHDCMIPPCPTRSYPGVWEVPMVMWQDLNGGRCSMGDACSNPPEAEGVTKMLMKNFERHFTTNRAPFGLFYHSSWFTQPHHKEGFIEFLDTIVNMPEVWIITNWQAVQWVRDPTPVSRLNNFAPFGCDYADRPRKCNNPKVCNLWHKSGVRYLKTCQPCPDIYPWTGKTGVRNSRVDNEDVISE